MSNTMNVNYMTRTYNSLLQNYETKNTDRGFIDSIVEKAAKSADSVAEVSKTGAVSTKDMTMEEYKAYISEKISQIPMHPTRIGESVSITISEAGFEAMKNDPEYEAWVLNDLKIGWSQPDKWAGVCGNAYSTIYYGASKEECHAEMWSAGYQNGNGKSLYDEKSQDSFLERRPERKQRLDEQYEELLEKKELAKKLQQRHYYAELAANKAENSRLSHSWNNERQMSQVFAAYEANVMTDFTESSDYVG